MSSSYDLVYSLPRDLYTARVFLALTGIPLFLFGRALRRRIEAADIWDWLGQQLVSGFLQFFGILMVVVFFIIPGLQGLYLGVHLIRGHFETVQGTVVDFTPGNGHVPEQWSIIDGDTRHTYSYNPYELTPGFDRIHGEGGPIRAGFQVRVADVGGHIARLEIAQPDQ